MEMQHVATLGDLAEDRPTAVKIADADVVLVREGDAVYAFGGQCPHAGAPLAEGAVCRGRIICPWHKAEFRVADGALLEPPALDPLPRYAVEIRDGAVFVAAAPLPAPPPANTTQADRRKMLIVGAGAAGTAAAAALREFGFAGEIALIGREPPYDRTALSKFVVAGEMKPGDVPPLREPDFFVTHRIDLIEADIQALDASARTATLADGRTLSYNAALIATGAEPKAPDLPGADLSGVHRLRNRRDAEAILEHAQPGARAVILGSSFIGLEVASGLRAQNIDVAVVTPEPFPFIKQFGHAVGAAFRALHERHGVRFHAETKPARIEGEKRVERVVLDDGATLPADFVIVGLGVRPATSFISGMALNEDGGIPVDAAMRAGGALFAAGDVAQFPLDGTPVRIEHWRVAQQQARIAARAMLGENPHYDGVPFFWTYHYGKRFDYLGHPTSWDDVVIDGQLEDAFVALLIRNNDVVGVLGCQRERATAVLLDRMRERLTAEVAMDVIRRY